MVSFNANGTAAIIDLVKQWNRGDLDAQRAMNFVADTLTDTFGSAILDDHELTVLDANGEQLRAGDLVLVSHPAGDYRGRVKRVHLPSSNLPRGAAIVEAPGYIRGPGSLGFNPGALVKVSDDGIKPVTDWNLVVQP